MNDGYYEVINNLQSLGKPFAVATVIAVRGSASAKPGSKAIISAEGVNLWGWVGGGCAETFVARNALEAMEEGQTRIIQADLDDEVFGLGMPCGGVMDIFIDPYHPPMLLPIATNAVNVEVVSYLAKLCGFVPEIALIQRLMTWEPLEHALYDLAEAVAAFRKTTFDHMRNTRGIPLRSKAPRIPAKIPELLIVGSSRITEELAKFAVLLRWPVRVYGWNADPKNYPDGVTIELSAAGFTNFRACKNSAVIIASHHKGDPQFIAKALEDKAAYVGLIASEKRSRLVFESLANQTHAAKSIFAPAGLVMNCRNPTEIALSCIAEIISFKTCSRRAQRKQNPQVYQDPKGRIHAEAQPDMEIL